MTAADRVTPLFHTAYSRDPDLVWAAPGRVNLIGEHTDYNDGFVLPFALPQRTAVAAGRHRGAHHPEWTVRSEATGETVTFGLDELHPGRVTGWAAYVAGVIWTLWHEGVDVPGADLAIASDVPLGSGLSSSAALECAVLGAMVDLSGAELDRSGWPALAQRAENAYVGVPCGIMDQSASTLSREGHALFLDCRSLATEHIPFALAESGLAILILDTRAPHRHVSNEYAARRATCEAAARELGVPALRDVTDLAAALASLPEEVSRRRVRHVVTENQRVLDTVRLLRAGRATDIGPLLTASHVSLRDDYQVTVAELDVAVDAARTAGAYGARMTGGGFGGCVIALVDTDRADEVAEAVAKAFASRGFTAPASFVALAGPGAGPVFVGGAR